MCCYAYLVRRKLAFPTLEHLCFLNHKHTFLCRTCRAKFLFEKQSDTYLHAIHNCHCHTGKYFLVCRDCEEEHLKDRIVVMPVIHIILGNGTDVQLPAMSLRPHPNATLITIRGHPSNYVPAVIITFIVVVVLCYYAFRKLVNRICKTTVL